ncbi:DUF11 domain-containing protein [Kitasatospora saccharophila]|uniref:DUF11 domain-containing protein n=1 Tax=Kitasatospora saccharophila TaxID=407973 RepID=A0ABP5JA14_9ACTN
MLRQPLRAPLARPAALLLAAVLAVFGLAAPAPAATPATSGDTFPNGTISAAYSDTDLPAGDAFTVAVTFTNTSATTQGFAYSFSARDGNDTGLFVLDSCDPASACDTPTSSAVRVRPGDLAAGTSATVTVSAHVNPAAAAGTYDVFQSGTVGTSSRKDFSPDLAFTVRPPVAADLSVALAATAGPLLSSQITYTATVTNNGPGTATASTTTVALPTQTTSVTGLPATCTYNATTRTATCTTGALANGASTTASFTANLGLLSLGTLTATATRATSTPADPNPVNDTATRSCTVLTGLIITCP